MTKIRCYADEKTEFHLGGDKINLTWFFGQYPMCKSWEDKKEELPYSECSTCFYGDLYPNCPEEVYQSSGETTNE